MKPAHLRAPYALLTKLFLRQFLENDLISPDADRSQLLAVVGSIVLSLTLFISVFMSSGYLGAFLTPGQAAIVSLDDKFFYLSLAMVVTALVAATQWDALAIDPRDAAILEPLPVPAATIRRAKVSAIALLGGAVALGVNVFPSFMFPWLLAMNFPQMSGWALLWLVVTQAMTSIAAAAFGYLTVIALRETMVAVLGRRWFTVAAPWVQGGLIVVLGSALLLLPTASAQIAQRGFDGWRRSSPPMWFLGIYEVTAGGTIADLPRMEMRDRKAASDRMNGALYLERRSQLPGLARRAAAAFGLAALLGAAAYWWNARRLPALAPASPPAACIRWRMGERLVNALLARDAPTRAGFYFTMAAMWRSNTHRLTLSGAAAAGLAMAVVALSSANAQQGAGPSARLLLMQPPFFGALLVGFRHVIRVPAELRASWGFQLAWRERGRAFLAGARRAALAALVLPSVLLLLPLFVFVLGPQLAVVHALLEFAGAVVLLEALMANYDKVPFTCMYVPTENMKALGPIYAIAFLIGASSVARMQNDVLQSGNAARLLITLAAAFAILRLMSVKRARLPHVRFDARPLSRSWGYTAKKERAGTLRSRPSRIAVASGFNRTSRLSGSAAPASPSSGPGSAAPARPAAP